MLKSRSFFQRRKDLWGENWGRMRKVWNVGCEKWKRELFTGQAMDSGWNVQNFGDLKEKCFPHTHTHAHTHTHTRAGTLPSMGTCLFWSKTLPKDWKKGLLASSSRPCGGMGLECHLNGASCVPFWILPFPVFLALNRQSDSAGWPCSQMSSENELFVTHVQSLKLKCRTFP